MRHIPACAYAWMRLYCYFTTLTIYYTTNLLLIYYTTIETLTGRSLGKFITKTKVVIYDGSKPTFNEILVRSLCRLIPLEHFSFLGEDGNGWHDSISKTYVVDIAKFEAKKATLYFGLLLETKDLLTATMNLLEEYYNSHDSSVEIAKVSDPSE